MTPGKKVARRMLSLLELAAEMNNIGRACKVMGYSRRQFSEIRRNYQTYGEHCPGRPAPCDVGLARARLCQA